VRQNTPVYVMSRQKELKNPKYDTAYCDSWSWYAQKCWLELVDPGRQTFWRRFHLPCVDGRLVA